MLHKDVKLYFYFIRHGESQHNVRLDLIGGRSPRAPLSKRGVAQATALAKRFRKDRVRFDWLYVSPLRRAVQTAAIIQKTLGLKRTQIIRVDALTEFDQGKWEGLPRKDVYTVENLNYINTRGYTFVPPGGESQRMVVRRTSAWLEDAVLYNKSILTASMPLSIAIVSHGIALKCLFHYIMGFTDRLIYRFRLDNASISRFLYKKEGWFPLCINDTAHLRDVGLLPDLHSGE